MNKVDSFIKGKRILADQRAFPNHHYTPETFLQTIDIATIPCLIGTKFGTPKFATCLRQCRFVTTVIVPVATMHKYDSMELGEHEVRGSR